MHNSFKIEIIRLHWIKDDKDDDPNDLCIHGELYLKIGEQILSDKPSGSWNLSTAVLYLMRTLDGDSPPEINNYLIPCCGHFWIPSSDGTNHISTLGCNQGIDFVISHQNGMVKFESENHHKGEITFDFYKQQIMKMVAQIDEFYTKSKPKTKPEIDFELKGYHQFWGEWEELKRKWK